MTIVLTGGGTGGHITPTLAVAHELKKLHPDCTIVYVIERRSRFADLVTADDSIDKVKFVFAGKWRRYHGLSRWRRLFDLKTNLLNLRDVFYLFFGTMQSLWLLGRLRPAAVFVKGGFVGLPVGFAAAVWRRPIVTHDSDTVPGLTNRIVSRWATVMATGMSAEFYNYPADKVHHIGVPVSDDFSPVSAQQKKLLREHIGIPVQAEMLLVTGGSLGAVRLNQAVAAIVQQLLAKYPNLYIVHQIGAKSSGIYADSLPERLRVQEFLKPLSDYSGAADVVITRPGATTMAELAAQSRACIIVPNPYLADGHQLKNATYLIEQGSVLSFEENDDLSANLLTGVGELLDNPEKAKHLATALNGLLKPEAAKALALLIDKTVTKNI